MSTDTLVDEEIDTATDAGDIDMLDDDVVHYCCTVCYPEHTLKPLQTFMAICGKIALTRYGEYRTDEEIPNPCEDCVKTMYCPKCGLYRWKGLFDD
jgi:hypothetical protein